MQETMGPRMRMAMESRNKNPLLSSTLRDMKFSPDTVCDTRALGIHQKMMALEREESLDVSSLDESSQPTYVKAGNMRTPPTTPTLVPSMISSSGLGGAPFVPKLPPRAPISKSRPRSISEGEASSPRGNRRAIFGQYWNQEAGCPTSRQQQRSPPSAYNSGHLLQHTFTIPETPPPPRRNRSSSMSKIDEVLPDIKDYRMFAPPREHADQSQICRRFASVEEVPMSPSLEALPPLPTPLRRLCSDGDSPGCLQGMYPMLTPIPILRQSSYRSEMDDNNRITHSANPKQSWYGADASFNLTTSWRPEAQRSFGSTASSSSTSGNSLSNGSGTGMAKANVRFDPRVTVTEFEDPIERSWYNEEELDKLKCETILLAQEYLLTHPDQAESYARAVMDPLTKTMRKKALFSLPILSAIDDKNVSNPDHQEYEKLVKSQVKTILIVDPNQAILNLFCKSMHSMFPCARLYKTQTAEEALHMVQVTLNPSVGIPPSRNFDIIIVEQRLYTPANRDSYSSVSSSSSNNNYNDKRHHSRHRNCESMFSSSSTKNDGDSFTALLKTVSERMSSLNEMRPFDTVGVSSTSGGRSSFSSVLDIGLPDMMTGSRLIELIQRLEEEAFDAPSLMRTKNHKEAPAVPCTNPKRALLIGVSVHPDRDAKQLKEAGADIVWGKPIPSIGEPLRNQLLHYLVNKRRRSLTCDAAPSSQEQQDEALT